MLGNLLFQYPDFPKDTLGWRGSFQGQFGRQHHGAYQQPAPWKINNRKIYAKEKCGAKKHNFKTIYLRRSNSKFILQPWYIVWQLPWLEDLLCGNSMKNFQAGLAENKMNCLDTKGLTWVNIRNRNQHLHGLNIALQSVGDWVTVIDSI